MPRLITDHHDGHGLNESIHLTAADAPDGSGASHQYQATIEGEFVAWVQFQKGPRPYGCHENAIQLTKLEECLHWTKARADERAKRGVLGKNQK